ncbi:MAG: 30S ribosomal protein S18 [Candidatus Levybacteria bacterium]|nr:30S ribosomal protein S18 [Candidatus Levybacteria bacterium]
MKKTIRKPRRKFSVPKVCYFCESKKEPSFWEMGTLQKFLTERGKIIPGSRNGLCIKHQKRMGSSIKHSRHLALM